MSDRYICPIVLAAGMSRRFGSDKLLHPISIGDDVQPIIIHTINQWLKVFECIYIVIRPDNYALIDYLESSPYKTQLKILTAHDAALGMSASLTYAIEHNKTADGWLIGLGDMPYLSSSVILDSLVALNAGAKITHPVFNEKRGHPVGFSSSFLPQLLNLTGDIGAKEILSAAYEQVTVIESFDTSIHRDIDYPEQICAKHND